MAVDKSPEAFRTISEVGEDLDLPQHVLRFWETRFAQIRPLKRGGGRRYYRPDDVDLLKGIRHYLYGEGYTIRGVQRILKDRGVRHVVEMGRAQAENYAPPVAVIPRADEAEERRARAAEWPEAMLRRPERAEAPAPDGAEPELAPVSAFVDPPVAGTAEEVSRPALSREDAHRLRTALIALGECRRLLDSAT